MMRLTLLSFLLFAATVPATPALTAPDEAAGNYLKLGDVEGETSATARGKEKWIEIQGWDFGARRKGWDGTVKGGSVEAAKYGAVSGVRRNDTIASASETEKRHHDWRPSPHSLTDGGIVRIKVKFPWVGCTVGDRVADATMRAGDKAYALTDLTIAACAADAVELDYKKVQVRGWNPETKEL